MIYKSVICMEVCRVLSEKGYGGEREMLKALGGEGLLYMGEELSSYMKEMGIGMGIGDGMGIEKEMLKECKSELNNLCSESGLSKLEGGGTPKLEKEPSEGVTPKLEGVSPKSEGVVSPKSQGVSPKINVVLPWCGEKLSGKCSALKLNSGLHTQCMKNANEKYCNGCTNLIEKNGGIAPYGTVEDRLKCGILEYVDPKGKQTIPYANVMKKLNITQEEALQEAEKLGWVIPQCHFEMKVSKRGRPKRDTSAEDTESEDGTETKKRGRPKKEKEIVSTSPGEDLIASLIEESKENSNIETSSSIVEDIMNPSEIDDSDSDSEGEPVVKFEINGTTYLKSSDNVLFDLNSHDCVGLWNEETKNIDEIPDDEE